MNMNQQCTLGAMDANCTVSRSIGSRSRELSIPFYVGPLRGQLLPSVFCPRAQKYWSQLVRRLEHIRFLEMVKSKPGSSLRLAKGQY